MGTKLPVIDIEVTEEQKKRIIQMSNEGKSLGDIKKEVFNFEFFGFYAKMPKEKKIYTHSLNIKIYEILKIKNYEEFSELYKKHRYKRRKDIPQSIKEEVMKRDNFQCRISYEKINLHIHHIDGNPLNNDVDNLILLSKKCHKAIHTAIIIGYSNKKLKNYDEIISIKNKYIKYLNQHGYPNAKIINDSKHISIKIN